MKKNFILLVLAAMLLPMIATAQELTVADGTATNSSLPCRVYSGGFQSELLYPASMLDELAGGSITGLTFYLNNSTTTVTYTNVVIRIDEPSDATPYVSQGSNNNLGMKLNSSSTAYFSGTMSVSGGEMTIDLDEAYTYSGGDLCINIFGTSSGGTPSSSDTYFKGETQSSNCCGYDWSISSPTWCSYSASTFLPKCTFSYTGGSGTICRKPNNLTVSNITTEGADFSWNTRNGESSWKVYIDGVEQSGTVSDSNYSATGLSSSSQHTFGVAAVCADGSVSGIASISFRTACGDASLPWSDNFNSYATGTGNNPDCWGVISTYTSYSTTYPYITSYGGSNTYYMYSSSSSSPNFVRTPVFTAPANQLQVVFRLYASSYGSAVFEAGIITDTANPTTSFIPMLTINGNNSTWTEYEFFTDTLSYTGNGCVGFRWTNNSGYSAYLDDVQVAVASNCRRPVDPVISGITYEGATISWTDNGDGATGYIVRCAKSNDVNAATAVDQNFGSAPAVVTGLDANSTYYAWVSTVCGNDTTLWRYCGSFTTEQDCYTLQSLTVVDKNRSSALVSWEYQERGREATGVELTLIDLTATPNDTTTVTAYGNSHFFTGLAEGHNYRVVAATLCDTYSASTTSTSFETETCGQMRGSTTTSVAPTYNSSYAARNSYTQSVYPASLLSGLSEVSGLRWRISSKPSGGYTRAIKVYLGTTDTIALDSTAAGHPAIDEMTLVYDGTVNLNTTGWLSIDFANEWAYDGSSNVVVAVLCNSGESSGVTWGATYLGTYSTIYWYGNENTTLDPANLSSNNYSSTQYLPDITFVGDCQTASCLAPLATASATTSTSVSLTWIAGSSENSWVVEHRAYGDTTWTVDATVSTTSYTVSNLANSTLYEFRVGSTCSDGTLYCPVFSARTECGAITLPFTETFEGWSGNNPFPTCWYKMLGTSSYPYVSSSASYRHSGTSSMYSYTSSSTVVLFASPEVPAAANNIKVTFWAYGFNTSGTSTQAGIVTDPTNPASFVPCTVVATGSTANSMTEYEFYTDNVTATGNVHVAFRFNTSSSIYIDDVTIKEAGNCRRPNTPSISNVSYYSATLHWNDVNHGAVSYQVCYNTVNDLETATLYTYTTNEDSLALEGLQNGQLYYTWVRPSCSNDDDDWLPMPSFTTEVSCYMVNNVALSGRTFTTAAITWEYNNATGLSPQGVILNLRDNSDNTMVQENIHTTDNAYIFTGLESGVSYTLFLSTVCDPDTSAERSFNFSVAAPSCGEAIGETYDSTYYYPSYGYYKYSYCQTLYDASVASSSDTIYGISLRVAKTSTIDRKWDVYMANTNLTTLSTSSFVAASQLTLVASNYTISSSIGWVDIMFDTPFINNGSNLVIAFNDITGDYTSNSQYYWGIHSTTNVNTIYSRRDGSPYTPSTFSSFDYSAYKAADIKIIGSCDVDNICASPIVISTAATTTSVTLQWAADDATSYTVQYKAPSDADWTDAASNLTATTYTVNGLEASQTYQFRVGISCGSSTIWSTPLTVSTECDAMSVPQIFTFTEEISQCWKLTNNYVHRYTSSTPYTLYFESTYNVSNIGRAILPEFALAVTNLKVTVHARSYSSESLMVGVGNSDGGNVTWIETFPINSTYTNYTVYFDSYTGTENHIVISKAGTYSMYIDSITVEEAESCRPVQGINLVSATENSATISWTHSSATSFSVEYRAVGASTWLSTSATSTTVTLTGLTPSTAYEIRIKANCSSSDQSPWSEPYGFRTECGLVTSMPYVDDFENYTSSAAPDCWTIIRGYNSYSYTYPYVGSSTYSAHGGSQYLYYYNNSYSSSGLFCTPKFGVSANTLSGSVWIKAYGEYYDDYYYDDYSTEYTTARVEMGVMTDLDDESTFTTILDTLINSYESSYSAQWILLNFSAANSGVTSTAYLAFRITMNSISDYVYAYIDDLTVNSDGSGPIVDECDTPTITSVNADETIITVAYNGTAASYELGIVNGATWSEPTNVVTSTTGTYTFSQLTASTTYTIGVRAVCGGGERSDWATQTVTTSAPVDPTCDMPTNINASNITANSATITWTAGGSETAWKLEVSGGGSTNVLDVNGTPSANLTNLTANTAYTVRVRAVCSATSMSEWTQAEVFQTTQTGIFSTEGNSVRLYPNPATSTVTVELEEPAEVMVVDINGRQVYAATTTTARHTIDVSALARGTYFVRVITADGMAVSKLAVQ